MSDFFLSQGIYIIGAYALSFVGLVGILGWAYISWKRSQLP